MNTWTHTSGPSSRLQTLATTASWTDRILCKPVKHVLCMTTMSTRQTEIGTSWEWARYGVKDLSAQFLLASYEPRPHRGREFSLVPSPSSHVRKRGSGVLKDFSCHSSPIWELESDCRMRNYICDDVKLSMRSSMHAVHGECILYAIWPRPMCRSEHQTLFPLLGGGVWARD